MNGRVDVSRTNHVVACVCFTSFQPVTESIATGEFLPPVTVLTVSAQMQVGVFIVGPAIGPVVLGGIRALHTLYTAVVRMFTGTL